MTSPLELIREGVASGDWQKVCDGYAGMTGVKVEPPEGNRDGLVISALLRSLEKIQDEAAHATSGRLIYGAKNKLLGEDAAPLGIVRAADPTPTPTAGAAQAAAECFDDDAPSPKPRAKKRPAEPAADPVSSRAREVRDAKAGVKAPADDYAKFQIRHAGPKRADGKVAARAEPFVPGMTNTWVDDRATASDELAESERMSREKVPEPRRPAVPKVEVTCCKCDGRFEVEPVHAPKGVGGKEDQPSSFVCNGCIKRGR